MAEIVSYSRIVHFGVILPNYGKDANPDGIRRVAEAAEELGFDSVWATEHIIVGPEAVDPYERVYAPLVTLGWIVGRTERIGLGTSIVLVPLHNPMTVSVGERAGGRLFTRPGREAVEDHQPSEIRSSRHGRDSRTERARIVGSFHPSRALCISHAGPAKASATFSTRPVVLACRARSEA